MGQLLPHSVIKHAVWHVNGGVIMYWRKSVPPARR